MGISVGNQLIMHVVCLCGNKKTIKSLNANRVKLTELQ